MESNNHKATVVMIDFSKYSEEGEGKIKSFVVPGHLEVRIGDVITWKSGDSSATFYFPKAGVFDQNLYKVKKGEDLELTVNENAPEGSFPYTIFTDNEEFAEGGSFPRVIVKR